MDPGVYIVRCAWGACRRRCGGGGVAGEAFGVGGSLLCSRCSGGGSLQIRRPRRVRRFLEPRRAFPRAGVRDGGAGSCSWGSSAFTSVLGGAFAQDLWELQAGCSSSTAGSDGVVEEGWCWRWLRADGRSPFRCRRLRRLDLAAFQQGWSGRRLRCEAVLTPDERKPGAPAEVGNAAATSRLQQFPPAPGANGGGYQPPGPPPLDGDVETQTSWKGYFNVASYAPYFNVDTDVVVDRLVSSVYPMDGFVRKIDANPDMYGPLWITTTLIFMLAAFGNFATYLMQRKTDLNIWNFDVGYFNWAASVMYGYAIVVPAAFYFLFQYFGSRPSLVRFWCMWGYSLFIFIPASILLLIPVEFLRWLIIAGAGGASSWFIALNLKECTEGADLMPLIASASVLQFALALFIKVYFFA